MQNIIDGKKTASEIKKEIKSEVEILIDSGKKQPHLAAILVGHNGGSETYVAYKIKDCEEVGYKSSLVRFEDDVSENELLRKIHELNEDEDVDGFHPVNVDRTVIGLPSFVSATPFGIIELLKRYQIETSGKNCVIVGRSNIVGRPLSILMSQKKINATVTVAHSRTKDLDKVCASADILIAALGSPEFIKADMVKEGAVVIDVGTTRVPSTETKSGFRLKGNVKYEVMNVIQGFSFVFPCSFGYLQFYC